MQKFMDAVRRYSGYTRFVEPVWQWWYHWVEAHPKTSAVALVVLSVAAVF